MNASRAVTLDRVPVYALILFILLSWAATWLYMDHSVITAASPFTRVWTAYSWQEAVAPVSWAVAGLVLAVLVPLPRVTASWRTITEVVGAQVRTLSWLWIVVTFGAMALLIAVKGEYLLVAPEYLAFVGPQDLVSAASVAQPMAVLAAGFISVRHPRAGRFALFMWFILLFASATRVFAGIVVLYVIGRFLAGGTVRWWGWLGSVLYTILALPIPLYSRNLDSHGLLPYAQAVWPLLRDPDYVMSSVITSAGSIGFTVPLLLFVGRETGISVSDMLVSLNPGPGSLVGWDQLAESMRVHLYIPYSALGEWASFGGLALMVFTLAWGVLVRLCLTAVASNPHPTMVLFLAAMLGMSMLTVVMITQYNTRSVARIVTVMIFLAVVDRLTRPLLARYTAPWLSGRGRHRLPDPEPLR